MTLICPECKNSVGLSSYPNLQKGHTLECQMCGISLVVTDMLANEIRADIVDEGK